MHLRKASPSPGSSRQASAQGKPDDSVAYGETGAAPEITGDQGWFDRPSMLDIYWPGTQNNGKGNKI